jgi:hypothetical protein
MDITAKDLGGAYQTAQRDPSIKTPDQYPSSGISIGACKKPPNLGVKVQLHDLVNYILRKGGWDKVRDKCPYKLDQLVPNKCASSAVWVVSAFVHTGFRQQPSRN